ncbi:MAG: PAS domain S-box protein [Elusimicrobia bacterium]|nr:PAS domain S-box protein [Elusimicrobiota bacterium]
MSNESFRDSCLGILKSFGKTLGLISLYHMKHPTVIQSLQETHKLIEKALEGLEEKKELIFALDQDKFLANGLVVCTVGQIPGAVRTLFDRFHLHSLSMGEGLRPSELVSFYELAILKPEVAKQIDLQKFLSEKSVLHIRVNEAVYAKVDHVEEAVPEETVLKPEISSGTPEWIIDLDKFSFEQSVGKLVEQAVEGEQDRQRVFEKVMLQFREDLEKRVQEATRQLESDKNRLLNEQVRTEQVLSKMAEGVVVVDAQGNVLMMNPTAEDITGKKLTEAAGKPVTEWVKKDEQAVALAKEIETPKDRPISKEVEVTTSEELGRTLRASTALVQNEEGKIVGTYATLPDVTKYKQVLHVQQEFVAHVTHELRAPLTSIRSALDILREEFSGKMSSEEGRIFATAVRNSERLADMITEILDFSKIQSGQMTVHPVPSNAEDVLREGVEGLRPWAKKKGLDLTESMEPELPQVMADGRRVVQVLTNLISNAIKFTESPGRITVSAKKGMDKNRGTVVLSVQDTGRGIPKSELNRVFEKFVQIASGEMHVEGTGLGLAIARALIHLHNGRMWVESEVGKGSVFHFTLPLYIPPPEERGVAKSAPESWWRRLLGLSG